MKIQIVSDFGNKDFNKPRCTSVAVDISNHVLELYCSKGYMESINIPGDDCQIFINEDD